jgi:hypothetical protein
VPPLHAVMVPKPMLSRNDETDGYRRFFDQWLLGYDLVPFTNHRSFY